MKKTLNTIFIINAILGLLAESYIITTTRNITPAGEYHTGDQLIATILVGITIILSFIGLIFNTTKN